jgi:protein SCO1/2
VDSTATPLHHGAVGVFSAFLAFSVVSFSIGLAPLVPAADCKSVETSHTGYVERENPINQSNRKLEWFVWGAILLTIVAITTAFVRSQIEKGQQIDLRPIAILPEFTLTNQDGRAVSLGDLRGNVWVGDIIFTRCPAICPVMTKRMSGLQEALPAKGVRLVTLTTDPAYDRPEVLKKFGERFKADFDRWTFLTGSKEDVFRVAVDGLKLVATEEKPGSILHSELFVLVDKQGQLRAAIQSDDPKMKLKVLLAIKRLLNEK